MPSLLLLLILSFCLIHPTYAAISADSAARLQDELTPIGAIRAGNRSQGIPQWEGGLSRSPGEQPPVPVQPYPNPFADDEPLYTITPSNWKRYQAQLTPGQQALLQHYPAYQLVVYPTRRSAAFPETFYQATQQLATTAQLTPTGTLAAPRLDGIPFPLPRNGQEALWNYQLRHQGQWLTRRLFQAIPSKQPYFTLTWIERWRFNTVLTPETATTVWQYQQHLQSPALLADQRRWLHAPRALNQQPIAAWLQLSEDSRARRLPTLDGAQTLPFSDGLQTLAHWPALHLSSQLYELQLTGRQVLFMPYNAYALQAVATDSLLAEQHLNQTLPRYEQHRVWVVMATRKDTAALARYHTQTLYFDEDSWHLLGVELYDAAGKLVQVIEHHPMVFYDIPTFGTVLTVVYDLVQQRYLVRGLATDPFLCDFHTPVAAQAMQPDDTD